MKQVIRFIAFDTSEFETVGECKRYTQRKYDDLLLKHSRNLAPMNYADTTVYLDLHLADLVALSAIRDSLALDALEDE